MKPQISAEQRSCSIQLIQSVQDLDATKSTLPLQDDDPVEVGPVKKLWTKVAGGVRDGTW